MKLSHPKIWSISDLHLSFGTPNKSMEIFGWKNHSKNIETSWREKIGSEDIILLAGDLSWAISMKEVIPDFEWLEALPGTKILIRGNHDYWWKSITKLRSLPFSSIHFIQNDSWTHQDVTIGGTRLWDSSEYQFGKYATKVERAELEPREINQAIFDREIGRLRLSCERLDSSAKIRIIMTHYPPIGADLADSIASKILESYHIQLCVFGHLHGLSKDLQFGTKNGIRYILTSSDHINFMPIRLL
ncbi:MAG: metallophosphoesterase [Chlamydiales bacterium]